MESWIAAYYKNLPEARKELEKLDADYKKRRYEFDSEEVGSILQNAKLWARTTGQQQTMTAAKAKEIMTASWKEKAHAIAKQYANDKYLNEINPEIPIKVKPDKQAVELNQQSFVDKIEERKEYKLELREKWDRFGSEQDAVEEHEVLALLCQQSKKPELKEYYKNELREVHGYTDEQVEVASDIVIQFQRDDQEARAKQEQEDRIKAYQSQIKGMLEKQVQR